MAFRIIDSCVVLGVQTVCQAAQSGRVKPAFRSMPENAECLGDHAILNARRSARSKAQSSMRRAKR